MTVNKKTTDVTMTGGDILQYAREQHIANSWDDLQRLVNAIDGMTIYFDGAALWNQTLKEWADPESDYYLVYPFCYIFDWLYLAIDSLGYPPLLPTATKLCELNGGPLVLCYMMAKAHLNGWRMPRPGGSPEEPFHVPYPLPRQFPVA